MGHFAGMVHLEGFTVKQSSSGHLYHMIKYFCPDGSVFFVFYLDEPAPSHRKGRGH